MSSQPQSDPAEVSSAPEWRRHLVVITCGVFLFLLLSGLLITLMPFGLTTQFLVLFHTGAGLAFIPLYVVYQVRHWLRFHGKTLTNIKYLGYTTLVATLISLVSGVWVTADAALGTKLDPLMDDLHLILSLVAGAILIWHLVLVLRLQRAWPDPETRAAYRGSHSAFFGRISGVAAALLIAVLGAGAIYHFTDIPTEDYSIPDDYVFKYGDNPFAPSLAMTADGGAVDPRLLAYSRRCGESGCHEQILKEWLPSAHRYSSMDLAFQAVQHLMAENEGPESTRYCAGCHDPIALFSGSKNLYNEDLSSFGADEGISCLVCHSITQADVKGNANYTLERPVPYAFALHDGPAAAFLSRFLVRSYPDYHVSSYKRELYKTPEFCGACHKQFIDQEINKVGWVQLQNQYDNWKASLWNRSEDPAKKITCNECHMRLMDSEDPGSGDDLDYNRSPDDGKTRHHGYIAANQFIPLAHGLEGAEEHVRLVEEWLKGETVIPEIADKWRGG
ncbi:MAG: multiheme c-type cytochrome, partial [Planctomycetota bacterium]